MGHIEQSGCIVGEEWAVQLALREALNNAVLHGNAMEPDKIVQVRCRCETGKGVWLEVRDQGKDLIQMPLQILSPQTTWKSCMGAESTSCDRRWITFHLSREARWSACGKASAAGNRQCGGDYVGIVSAEEFSPGLAQARIQQHLSKLKLNLCGLV